MITWQRRNSRDLALKRVMMKEVRLVELDFPKQGLCMCASECECDNCC